MKDQTLPHPIQSDAFVEELATVLGMPKNPTHAKRILCAFFQTIRARIPPIASSVFMAHLPKDLKRTYMDGWNNRFSPKFDYDEFIDALYDSKGMEHRRLFSSKTQVETSVYAIFEVIKERLTDNQYSAVMALMPLLLRVNLVTDFIFEGHSYVS